MTYESERLKGIQIDRYVESGRTKKNYLRELDKWDCSKAPARQIPRVGARQPEKTQVASSYQEAHQVS